MKNSLIIFCSVTLIVSLTVFAYNSDKGRPKQKDGIAELPKPVNNRLFNRGKYLLDQAKYNEQDLNAISVYLNNR